MENSDHPGVVGWKIRIAYCKNFRGEILKRILITLLIAVGSFVGIFSGARAQMTAPSSAQTAITKLSTDKNSPPPTEAESMTFESGIDPREYHLGPGDVMQCRFWASGEAFYPVVSSDYVLL